MLPASWCGPRANPRGSLSESAEREVVDGLDIMILRELTGDVYFGDPRGTGVNAAGEREAFDTMRSSEPEIERIAHVAFRTARSYSYRRYGFVGLFGPCDVDTLIYTSGASAPD